MPAAYLARLAEHFLTVLMLDVILVTAPCRLRGGTVHLAASDGWHMALSGPGAQDLLVPVRVEPADLHVPSIDTLFGSIARSGRSGSTLACLMTGMASDGACGLRALRDGGAETWVEDPRTANVPSMPEAAISRGAACRVLTRQAMAAALASRFGKSCGVRI
jgi:two-component system chemotaxis response regulator CheB